MLSKKFAVGFGIAIILPMLIHYGVSTFSLSPKLSDYYQNNYDFNRNESAEQREKNRQEMQRKQVDFRNAQKKFQQHLFFVAVPIGIAAILVGASTPIQAIGTGLMFGGIFTVMDGYLWYWSELQDSLRFLSLLVAFIVLIYVGYRKLAK
jgi:hypothetical protein